MDRKEQYTLRVKRGGLIERILEAASDKFVSRNELVAATGLGKSFTRAGELGRYFDNVSVMRDGGNIQVRYVEVRPQVIQSIKNAEFMVEGSGREQQDDGEVGGLVWPDAPPFIEQMDNFRKPSFYGRMGAMVGLGKHISLAGPPGIGKSTSVEQWAAECGMPLVNVGGDAGLRKRDLIGTQEIHNGSTKFLVAEFAAAVVNGWWAKIDEVNAADPDVIMLLNAVMAPPYVINIHGRQYPVHPDFRLFVTYNPGLIGTKPLPPAFKDRFFPIKLEFPTESQLRKILVAHGMPAVGVTDLGDENVAPLWTRTIVNYGLQMWEAHKRGQMRYQISPRRLIDTVVLMNNGIVDSVKVALKAAVVATIDSPIESKVAEDILRRLN